MNSWMDGWMKEWLKEWMVNKWRGESDEWMDD